MISGMCHPCKNIAQAGTLAHSICNGQDVLKFGRDGKVWYVVQQFNQSKKDTQ